MLEFLDEKVLFISLFILLIHCIETLAYAVRLSGARVRLIASALSLFNIMVIFSRFANMMQQPFTGSFIDTAPQENAFQVVEMKFRFILGASTIGTLIGILLLPTFVAVFSRAIIVLSEERGSVVALIKRGFSLTYMRRGLKHIRMPKMSYVRDINWKQVPISLFFFNMVITGIYTIGVLAALYGSLLVPERATTIIMASGLINGVATILLTIFVDPKVSVMADDVVNQRGSYTRLKTVSIMMIGSRFIGTILAQLLFIPGAHYIAWLTKFIV